MVRVVYIITMLIGLGFVLYFYGVFTSLFIFGIFLVIFLPVIYLASKAGERGK